MTGDHNSYHFSWSFRTFPKCNVFVFSTLVTWSFSLFLRLSSSWICFFFELVCVFFKEVIKRWESVRRSVWRRLTAGWKGHFQKDKKLGVGYFTSVLFPGIFANGTMLMWGLFQKWRTTCIFFHKDKCQSRNKKSTWQVNIKKPWTKSIHPNLQKTNRTVWLRSVPRFLLPHIQTHCSSQGVWGMTHQVWANPKPSNMQGNHRGRTIPGGWRRPGRLCLHATWPNLWLKKSLRIHENNFSFWEWDKRVLPPKLTFFPWKMVLGRLSFWNGFLLLGTC